MKKLSILFAVIALLAAPSAQAAPIDLFAALGGEDLGALQNNASGDLNAKVPFFSGFAYGTIPAQSKVTFTYNIMGTPLMGGLVSAGRFNEATTPYTYYAGSDGSNFKKLPGFWAPLTPVSADNMPVQAAADQKARTTTITNLTNSAAGFATSFVGIMNAFGFGGKLVSVSYNVSAVPLPAALPLFGLALAGVAGYSRRRKAA